MSRDDNASLWSVRRSRRPHPMLMSLLGWVGYMAVEPYARRIWPQVMISWQRLLSGRLRDPLIGRDLLLGILAGSAVGLLNAYLQQPYPVDPQFGMGVLPSISDIPYGVFWCCLVALFILAILSALTGLFRRKWLGMLATGILLIVPGVGQDVRTFAAGAVVALGILFILTRVGLVATVVFVMCQSISCPPLVFSQWYASRAIICLMLPLGLLIYGFWVSLGGQPILGSLLREE